MDDCKFKELYSLYFDRAVELAVKIVKDYDFAKDVAQDTFVYLWRRRERFETINNDESFVWISVKNMCLTKLKQKKQKRKHNYNYVSYQLLTARIQACFAPDLIDVLRKLPKKQQIAFSLTHIDNMNYETAMKIVGCKKSTFSSLISEATQSIKKIYSFY